MIAKTSTCAELKQAWADTELVASEQGSHLEDGGGRTAATALICLCILGPIEPWLVLGSALFSNLPAGLNSLLVNRGRIFATLVRDLDFLSFFCTSSTYIGASVGVGYCI